MMILAQSICFVIGKIIVTDWHISTASIIIIVCPTSCNALANELLHDEAKWLPNESDDGRTPHDD